MIITGTSKDGSNFLLLSDIGGKVPDLQQKYLDVVDAVLIAGDITLGARSERRARKTFDALSKLFPPPIPVYFIPGNHDYPYIAGSLPWFPPNFIQMHDREVDFNGKACIIGFGGASLGLYNNFAFPDETIEKRLDALFKKHLRLHGESSPVILLVHDPPRDTKLDITIRGDHVGSIAVRKIIMKYQPLICVAGHIHESAAIDKLGSTHLVNAGEARRGNHALIHWVEGEKVKISLIKG